MQLASRYCHTYSITAAATRYFHLLLHVVNEVTLASIRPLSSQG